MRWRAAWNVLVGRHEPKETESPPELVLVLVDGRRIVYPRGAVDRIEIEGCWYAPEGLRALSRADGQPFHAARVGTSLQLHFIALSPAEVAALADRLRGPQPPIARIPVLAPSRGGDA